MPDPYFLDSNLRAGSSSASRMSSSSVSLLSLLFDISVEASFTVS